MKRFFIISLALCFYMADAIPICTTDTSPDLSTYPIKSCHSSATYCNSTITISCSSTTSANCYQEYNLTKFELFMDNATGLAPTCYRAISCVGNASGAPASGTPCTCEGGYGTTDNISCIQCLAGQYSPAGNNSCLSCDAGTFSNVSSTIFATSQANCAQCGGPTDPHYCPHDTGSTKTTHEPCPGGNADGADTGTTGASSPENCFQKTTNGNLKCNWSTNNPNNGSYSNCSGSCNPGFHQNTSGTTIACDANELTINYNLDGGSWPTGYSPPTTPACTYSLTGSCNITLTKPTKTGGWTFDGWQGCTGTNCTGCSGTIYAAGTPVSNLISTQSTGDVILNLYAQWTLCEIPNATNYDTTGGTCKVIKCDHGFYPKSDGSACNQCAAGDYCTGTIPAKCPPGSLFAFVLIEKIQSPFTFFSKQFELYLK